MLDYQQIKKGKFRKNISKFNIVNTIDDVMRIQRMQAKDKNLVLKSEFININLVEKGGKNELYSPIIETDE